MGLLVWRRVGIDRAMVPYGVQLVLNAAWVAFATCPNASIWWLNR